MVIQPTRYSCFAACLSFLCDTEIHEIFTSIGHNGHEQPFTDEQLQHWCLFNDYILTRFDHNDNLAYFDYAINRITTPLILRIATQGEHDHAVVLYTTPSGRFILDPKDGSSYPLNKLTRPVTAMYVLTELEP